MEYWLISAPGDKTCQQTFDKLNNAAAKQNNYSVNYKFQIPELKVGTLDVLVGLSDDLGKLDLFCEGVTRKVAHCLSDVLGDHRDKLQENLVANGMDLATYVQRFQWDLARYPIKVPLPNLADIISKRCTQIDNDLKAKSTAYNTVRQNLESLERKQTGSLFTRALGDIVKREHFVLESEHLVTLVVVIPKGRTSDWFGRYEKLADYVVPRSSQQVFEDPDSILVTVTLFRRVVDEFKHHCRENKFVVRDFEYNEATLSAGKSEVTRLEDELRRQYSVLVRWLKVNFSEAFTAWIHVKALRVFVESVLRYGLPVNFQAILLHPQRKTMKRLREVLAQLYFHLDNNSGSAPTAADMEIPGLMLGQGEYFPYVSYKVNLDMMGH